MPDQQSRNTEEGKTSARSSPFQLPTISLPKGGGAIRGIGEKCAANPVTGTGCLSAPLATIPGHSGFGPELTLSYDSGSGNRPLEFGWSLSPPFPSGVPQEGRGHSRARSGRRPRPRPRPKTSQRAENGTLEGRINRQTGAASSPGFHKPESGCRHGENEVLIPIRITHLYKWTHYRHCCYI
jgi:virulence plasmid B protein